MALFSALKQIHCALVACDFEWVTVAFYSTFWVLPEVMYFQCCLVLIWLVPRETAAMSAHSVYTIQLCIMSFYFMQSHIRRLHAWLAVTCHLHFEQNDQDLLHATVATQWWNRYWNKSQHRKLTLQKKSLLPPLLTLEPATLGSQVQHSDRWAMPAPQNYTGTREITTSGACVVACWDFPPYWTKTMAGMNVADKLSLCIHC